LYTVNNTNELHRMESYTRGFSWVHRNPVVLWFRIRVAKRT